MTVTIPTGNLIGAIADVIPFASPEKDFPHLNAVHLEWDGHQFHASATDARAAGISSWSPDDDTWGVDVAEDDLFTEYGSGDNPWAITISLDDAKELVSDYKLPPKLGRAPLTVDYDPDRNRVTVTRARETGHPAKKTTVDAIPPEWVFPDVRGMLAASSDVEAVRTISYDPKRLAVFSKVRPVGTLELTFTGPFSVTLASIGDRFVGGLMPVKVEG